MEVWLSGPTTSITDIQNSPVQPRAIYNLQGQRLSKPQRGINIMDGKKYENKILFSSSSNDRIRDSN